jgi:hypothetical protein
MAPVAPNRADIEKNGLVFGLGSLKCFLVPVSPSYRTAVLILFHLKLSGRFGSHMP